MVPSVVLIFLVLGTIFMGLATPTEAGAMGAVGAMALAALHRRLTWNLTWDAMDSTMRITAMVIFILIGATVFCLVFQGVNGGKWIEHILSDLPGGRAGFLIFINLFVFFLAFFLDFFEIAFIVVPMLVPVAKALDVNLVWFGVLLCVNMQTSFMHPPFGFALFYLRGIAPKEVKSSDIYWGSIPWIVLQLILVGIVIAWPESVTYWLGGRRRGRSGGGAAQARQPALAGAGPARRRGNARAAGPQSRRAAEDPVSPPSPAPRGGTLAKRAGRGAAARRLRDKARCRATWAERLGPRPSPGLPSAGHPLPAAGRGWAPHPRARARIMKLSKVYSATWNHRYCSPRKARSESYIFFQSGFLDERSS